MRTWREKIENLVMKCPPIGTPEWFACIPPVLSDSARELVANRVPVVVQRQTSSDASIFKIVFDGTDFVAGGFDDHLAAGQFAEAWNRQAQQ